MREEYGGIKSRKRYQSLELEPVDDSREPIFIQVTTILLVSNSTSIHRWPTNLNACDIPYSKQTEHVIVLICVNPSASPVKLDLCCWLCQSPEVDVFAAGVILYFMLRGKLPFSANTQEETLEFLGLSKRSMYIYIYINWHKYQYIYIYININETAEMTGHHAAWKGHLGGQELSGPGKVHKQLRKTVKCDVSYSAKPFAEVSPGIIDVMKMTLVENSPGMSSTKCTYSNSLRIWVGCGWYKTLTCHSQWIDSVEICDLVWALGHLVSSPYRPQAFLKTFGLDAIKKENALVLSLWKVNWTCKNSIQGLSIVMCIVDQVPLSAFTKSTRLQAQKWGQPWDFLSTDSKWSSSQASYSSSMETHSLESSRSSDVTRDSGTTTRPHGSTKLVDSLQELGGLPNRQDGLGDLSSRGMISNLSRL